MIFTKDFNWCGSFCVPDLLISFLQGVCLQLTIKHCLHSTCMWETTILQLILLSSGRYKSNKLCPCFFHLFKNLSDVSLHLLKLHISGLSMKLRYLNDCIFYCKGKSAEFKAIPDEQVLATGIQNQIYDWLHNYSSSILKHFRTLFNLLCMPCDVLNVLPSYTIHKRTACLLLDPAMEGFLWENTWTCALVLLSHPSYFALKNKPTDCKLLVSPEPLSFSGMQYFSQQILHLPS